MIIGKKAPFFKAQAVINNTIKEVAIDDFKERYKVIFFYPLDFTFICPTEIRAFQDLREEFKKRDAAIMGISVDSVYSHLAWLNTPVDKGGIQGVEYPLISDITKSIAQGFGVLNEEQGIAYRGVFVLDKNNIVQAICINNLNIGRNIDEVLRLVDALEFNEKNGAMCPANWQKGDSGIK